MGLLKVFGKKISAASVILLAGMLLSSCINKGDIDRFVDEHFSDDAITGEAIGRSFEEIRESGVLRMITGYSASTYFLHQGMDAGFEYELLQAFAREHNLMLEVVLMGPDDDPLELLHTGDGDVIANNFTITPERRRAVNFTQPYNLIDRIVVYSADLEKKPETLEELSESNLPIMVKRNSSRHIYLNDLRERGYELTVRQAPDDMDTESLLARVTDGTISATVLDENMFRAAGNYMEGLAEGPKIAENDTIAWAIRKSNPELETAMNDFLQKHFRFAENRTSPNRSAFLNLLEQRYFEESPQIAAYYDSDSHYSNVGLFSAYADVVKSTADSLDLDWLLLTSIIAQESNFDSESKSWAGAVGLMQVLPRYSTTEYQLLYEPVINIREGAGILKQHLDHYAYLDSLNQWPFALATYNAGIGHMVDARRLVMEQNRDPNEWENVADALLKLMQPRYYQQARYGYSHGIETVQYVTQVLNRYERYNKVVSISEERSRSAGVAK